jgi:endonuclease/exonuclease/phosphatase family metal-dependent hydrolase
LGKSSPCVWPTPLRAVSWNINRGLQLDGVIDFLRASGADLILLQETEVSRIIPGEPNQSCLAWANDFVPPAAGERSCSQVAQSVDVLAPRWYIPRLACLQRRLGGRMALICEITLGARTLLTYDVHLESRGSDELRIHQLAEILADIGRQPADTPVLMAGDFNFDLFRGPAVSLLAGAQMNHAFASFNGRRTVMKSRRAKPAAIDWMLTRGPLSARRPAIRESIAASDHFPLSLELYRE